MTLKAYAYIPSIPTESQFNDCVAFCYEGAKFKFLCFSTSATGTLLDYSVNRLKRGENCLIKTRAHKWQSSCLVLAALVLIVLPRRSLIYCKKQWEIFAVRHQQKWGKKRQQINRRKGTINNRAVYKGGSGVSDVKPEAAEGGHWTIWLWRTFILRSQNNKSLFRCGRR